MSFRKSRPHAWVEPHPRGDEMQRQRAYGRLQPMERPGLLRRLLRLD